MSLCRHQHLSPNLAKRNGSLETCQQHARSQYAILRVQYARQVQDMVLCRTEPLHKGPDTHQGESFQVAMMGCPFLVLHGCHHIQNGWEPACFEPSHSDRSPHCAQSWLFHTTCTRGSFGHVGDVNPGLHLSVEIGMHLEVPKGGVNAVSYTHLTLPTRRTV